MRTSADSEPEGFYAADSNEYGRGVSFFDAIYGFSATLLIANLDAPPAEAWHDMQSLIDSGFGTQLYGFVLSFVVIVVFWRANVQLMRNLTGLDGPTMIANLVTVGLVIVIPFTTQGISDPRSADFALPTALYALNIALAALAQMTMAGLGHLRGLEREPVPTRVQALDFASAALLPVVFGISIPITLAFGPAAGQWTWASLAVLMPLAALLTRRAQESSRSPGSA